MKTQPEIITYINNLRIKLRNIEKNIPAGKCHWRITKAEIEILEWVLDIE